MTIKKVSKPYNLEALCMLGIHILIIFSSVIILSILLSNTKVEDLGLFILYLLIIYLPIMILEYIFTFRIPFFLLIEKLRKNNSLVKEVRIEKICESVSTSGFAYSCILDKFPPYYSKYIVICNDKAGNRLKLRSAVTAKKIMLLDELSGKNCFINIEYTKLSKVILSYVPIKGNNKNEYEDIRDIIRKINKLE